MNHNYGDSMMGLLHSMSAVARVLGMNADDFNTETEKDEIEDQNVVADAEYKEV